jgi:hypothetical protein
MYLIAKFIFTLKTNDLKVILRTTKEIVIVIFADI